MQNVPIDSLGDDLFTHLRTRSARAPLTDSYPDLTIEQAYHISLRMLACREAEGESVIGKKIGLTSEAVQSMLGVDQPDFGFLTDAMWVKDGHVSLSQMIAPRAEAEIAFRLKSDLIGPGISAEDVLAATEYVMACFEIVDSRIADWNIKIQDTVADNASCGVFVLGEEMVRPHDIDLSAVTARVTKNNMSLSQGVGAAVQGSPLNAVAWLANTLGGFGIPFKKGEIVLSGSLVPLEPVVAGDQMSVDIDHIGTCAITFT